MGKDNLPSCVVMVTVPDSRLMKNRQPHLDLLSLELLTNTVIRIHMMILENKMLYPITAVLAAIAVWFNRLNKRNNDLQLRMGVLEQVSKLQGENITSLHHAVTNLAKDTNSKLCSIQDGVDSIVSTLNK